MKYWILLFWNTKTDVQTEQEEKAKEGGEEDEEEEEVVLSNAYFNVVFKNTILTFFRAVLLVFLFNIYVVKSGNYDTCILKSLLNSGWIV